MSLSEKIAGIPGRIRKKLAEATEYAISPIDHEVKKVLGVQGSKQDRSKPGEPPRRQTGKLQSGSGARWQTSPQIRIVIYTTQIGLWLDKGTKRILPRPILNHVLGRINPFVRNIVKRSLEK